MDYVHSTTDLTSQSWANLPFTYEEQYMLWSTCLRPPDTPMSGISSASRDAAHISVPQKIYQDFASAPRDLLTFSAANPYLDGAKDAAPATTPTLSAETPTKMSNQPTYMYPDCLSTWHIPAPPPIDLDSVDPFATLVPPPHSEVPLSSSSATPATSWEELTPQFEEEQSINAARSATSAGPLTSEYGTNPFESVTHLGFTHPGEWDTAGHAWPVSTTIGDVEASPAVTSMLDSDLLRCHHDTEIHGDANAEVLNGDDVLPQKRFDEGAALTVNDASVVRVPNKQDNRSKVVRHGAKTPTTLDAQGSYYPSLLGPSFQQGRSVTSAQEQTAWVEGRVEEKEWQPKDSAERLQAKDNLIPIPKSLDKGYRTLLAATEANWERESIQRIMCRLCLGVGFKTWESFKRHCDTMETHPLKITFCHSCGDFFARRDSLERHRRKPPLQCRNVRPEKAQEKRRETLRVHEEFKERLEQCMKNGKEVEMHFAQVIKKMYPESSKKRTGSKEQS